MNKDCSDQSVKVVNIYCDRVRTGYVSRLQVCAECTSQFESYISQYNTCEEQHDNVSVETLKNNGLGFDIY